MVANTVAVLAYNEAATLPALIEAIDNFCRRQFGDDYETLIIDDASTDATESVVERLVERFPRTRLFRHDQNLGYAFATRSALKMSVGNVVFVIDGDGQHPPQQILEFLGPLGLGYDIVLPHRTMRAEPIQRRIASRILTAQCRLLLGFPGSDINGGIKALTRSAIKNIEIRHQVNLVNPEIYASARSSGFRVGFAQVEQLARADGTPSRVISSPVSLFIKVNRYLLALRREYRPTKSRHHPSPVDISETV